MEIFERNTVIAALHDRLLLVPEAHPPAAHPPATADSPGAAFARFRIDRHSIHTEVHHAHRA